jgi:hypothetical protein
MNLVVAKKKKKTSAKPSSTRLSKRCRPPLMGFAHAWVAVSLSVAHAEVSPLAGCGGHEGRVGPNSAGDSVSQRVIQTRVLRIRRGLKKNRFSHPIYGTAEFWNHDTDHILRLPYLKASISSKQRTAAMQSLTEWRSPEKPHIMQLARDNGCHQHR